MNAERYRTLSKCLVICEAMQRSFSTNEAMEMAKPGYEQAFEDARNDCAVIREMLIETRYN